MTIINALHTHSCKSCATMIYNALTFIRNRDISINVNFSCIFKELPLLGEIVSIISHVGNNPGAGHFIAYSKHNGIMIKL